MPARRGTRRTAMPTGLQSKLSFHSNDQNRVTKASQVPHNAKSPSQKGPSSHNDLHRYDRKSEPELESVAANCAIKQQVEAETSPSAPLRDVPFTSVRSSRDTDLLGDRVHFKTLVTTGGHTDSGWLGDEEIQARKISANQIHQYWRNKEAERLAPRVHQQDLSTHEKILREWDMSGQYGPCIGISRLKRWKRANLLKLNPPIEVLAVLFKEMDGDDPAKSQRAHVDELMSSRFAETSRERVVDNSS